MVFGRGARRIAPEKTPQHSRIVAVGDGGEVQQHREARQLSAVFAPWASVSGCRRLAGMNVPGGIAEPLLPFLARIGVEKAEIIVDRARDHVEMQPLGRRRLLEHEQRQALRARVGQPLVDRQAIALRLRNLLALLVEEQFVVEAGRRLAAERAHDLRGQLDADRSDPCRPSRNRPSAHTSASPSRASIAACSGRR